MFRQKPANKKAVAYLETYLNALKNGIKNPSVEAYKVAKRTPGDLTAMKITKKENGNVIWLAGDKDIGVLALEVLNHRLKKSKKQIHVPIPEFAAIGDTLKTISERLAHITAQHERSLKRAENSFIDIDAKGDLFTVDQQRLEIAAAIASAVHKDHHICDHEMISVSVHDYSIPGADRLQGVYGGALGAKCRKCGYVPNGMIEQNIDEVINQCNNYIVKATDDLMAKLLRRYKPDAETLEFMDDFRDKGKIVQVETPDHTVIAKCHNCKSDIYADETYIMSYEIEPPAYFCKKHVPTLMNTKITND